MRLARKLFGMLKHNGLLIFVVFAFSAAVLVPDVVLAAHVDSAGNPLPHDSGTFGATGIGTSYAVNMIMSILTTALTWITGAIGKMTLMMIEIIIIPVLNYNSFSSSPIIGLGWSLVRDVMNMFVIVALIAIAIFTIVGNHRAHWEQQLPQLFIAVVMMNFSRTICGLLIDISQVIMFTFVNALLDIAAGNFAQMFNLPSFGQLNEEAARAALDNNSSIVTPFSNFIAAFLQIPLYGSILAIMVLLALAFIYRIVVLWVLVILSPAAFFLKGVEGIFHGAGGSTGKWWSMFTGALTMGPILTFFLWLSLAAASSGSLAESEGFPMPANSSSYFSTESLDSSNITSLLLALVLLVVGMQIAGEQSSKVGGYAASLINEGMGRRVVSGALSLSTAPARYAAAEAAARANRRVGEAFGSKSATELAGQTLVRAGGAASAVPLVGGLAARGLTLAGGSIEGYGEHARKAREDEAAKIFAGKSDAQKAQDYELMVTGGGKGNFSTEQIRAAQKAQVFDGKFRNERAEYLESGLIDKYLKQGKSQGEAHDLAKAEAKQLVKDDKMLQMRNLYADKEKLDEDTRNKLYTEMIKDLDVVDEDGSITKALYNDKNLDDTTKTKLHEKMSEKLDKVHEKDPELALEFARSDKLKASKLRDNTAVFGNSALTQALDQNVESRKGPNGEIVNFSVLDRAKGGELGLKVREQLKPVPPNLESQYREALVKPHSGEENTVAPLVRDYGSTIANITKPEDLRTPQARDLGKAFVESGVDISRSPAKAEIKQNIVNEQGAPTITTAIRQEQVTAEDFTPESFAVRTDAQYKDQDKYVVQSVVDSRLDTSRMAPQARASFTAAVIRQDTDGKLLTRAIEQKQVSGTDLTKEHFSPGNPNQVTTLRSVIQSKMDISTMTPEAKGAFISASVGQQGRGNLSVSEKTAAQEMVLNSGEKISEIYPAGTIRTTPAGTVEIDDWAKTDLKRLAKSDSKNLRHFASIPSTQPDEKTKLIVESMKSDKNAKLKELAKAAVNATGDELKHIKESVQVLHDAIELEKRRPTIVNAPAAGYEGPVQEGAPRIGADLNAMSVETERIRNLLG